MIRHVALFDLRDDADIAQVEEALTILRQLDPGIRDASWGPDAGLREGNAGFTSVWDLPTRRPTGPGTLIPSMNGFAGS